MSWLQDRQTDRQTDTNLYVTSVDVRSLSFAEILERRLVDEKEGRLLTSGSFQEEPAVAVTTMKEELDDKTCKLWNMLVSTRCCACDL